MFVILLDFSMFFSLEHRSINHQIELNFTSYLVTSNLQLGELDNFNCMSHGTFTSLKHQATFNIEEHRTYIYRTYYTEQLHIHLQYIVNCLNFIHAAFPCVNCSYVFLYLNPFTQCELSDFCERDFCFVNFNFQKFIFYKNNKN
jgi:hypothetical protein